MVLRTNFFSHFFFHAHRANQALPRKAPVIISTSVQTAPASGTQAIVSWAPSALACRARRVVLPEVVGHLHRGPPPAVVLFY